MAPDEQQAGDYRKKAECVEQKKQAHRTERNNHAPQAGTHDPREPTERGSQGNGVGQIFTSDQFHDKRLTCRSIQAIREAQQERQNVDVPELNSPARYQQPEKERLKHRRSLGGEQNAPSGPAIDEDAPEEREEKNWQGLQSAHQTELPGAVRQFQHQPGLPDALHIASRQRNHLPEPVETIIARAQRAKGSQQAPLLGIAHAGRGDLRPWIFLRNTRLLSARRMLLHVLNPFCVCEEKDFAVRQRRDAQGENAFSVVQQVGWRVYRKRRQKTSSKSTLRTLDNYDTIKMRKGGICKGLANTFSLFVETTLQSN